MKKLWFASFCLFVLFLKVSIGAVANPVITSKTLFPNYSTLAKFGAGPTYNGQPIQGGGGGTGSMWYSASSTPSSNLGVPDDYFLRTDTYDIYKKTTNGWGSPIGNLKGTQGPAGTTGATGSPGAAGPTGPQGPQGAAGQGFNLRGIWTTSPTGYVLGDEVSYNGSSYVAMSFSSGVVPGTDITKWVILAAKGDTGSQGVQGFRGYSGAKGAKGDTGSQGAQGIQGIQGVAGAQGVQGATGATGSTGSTGATGAAGAAGVKGDKGDTGVGFDSAKLNTFTNISAAAMAATPKSTFANFTSIDRLTKTEAAATYDLLGAAASAQSASLPLHATADDSAKLGGTAAATVVNGAAAGATALQPTGIGAGLTGITAGQVGAYPVINVKSSPYSAYGDGIHDDSTAINSAILALPATGGTVYFPIGTYLVGSSIVVGNGTSTSWSTRQGIKLVGEGDGGSNFLRNYAGSIYPVVIKVAAGIPGILVQGPLSGWGIENINIIFSTSSTSAIGLKVVAGQKGYTKNLDIERPPGVGVETTTPTTYTGTDGHNSSYNIWENVSVLLSSSFSTSVGIWVHGITSTGANSCFDTWRNLTVNPSGSDGPTAIKLGNSDNITFMTTSLMGYGALRASGIVFDYSEGYGQPRDNHFYGLDTGNNTLSNVGIPAVTDTNKIYGFATTNGAVDPSLTNLVIINAPYVLPLVTSVGSPGDDAHIPSERAVRSAIAASSVGLSDPGANGIVKRSSLNTSNVASYSDVVSLFGGGTCSGFLKNDGTCGVVSSSGNVVSTGTPITLSLPIYSDTSGTAISPSNVTIDSTGKILNSISDGSPKLVVRNLTSSVARFPTVSIINYLNGQSSGSPALQMTNSGGNSVSPSVTPSGTTLFSLQGIGATDTSFGTKQGFSLNAFSTGAFSAVDQPTAFAINLGDFGSNGTTTERFRISPSGNVSIGSPTDNGYKLEVTGTTNLTQALTGTTGTFSGAVKAAQFTETAATATNSTFSPAGVTESLYAYTLNANATINLPTTGLPAGVVTLNFEITGSSAYTITWAGGTRHVIGSQPSAITASKLNYWTATTRDQGANWSLFYAGVEQ